MRYIGNQYNTSVSSLTIDGTPLGAAPSVRKYQANGGAVANGAPIKLFTHNGFGGIAFSGYLRGSLSNGQRANAHVSGIISNYNVNVDLRWDSTNYGTFTRSDGYVAYLPNRDISSWNFSGIVFQQEGLLTNPFTGTFY